MLLWVELNLVTPIPRQDIEDVHRVEFRALQNEAIVLGINLARGIEPAKTGVQCSTITIVQT
jgi:hypothetical protein